MFLFQAITAVLLSTASPRQVKVQEQRQTGVEVSRLRAAQICRRFDAIVVDVENVRGRSGFAVSHADLLETLDTWTNLAGVSGKVTLAIDHGLEACSYWLNNYAIVFAGSLCKADDTIAQELVPFYSDSLQLKNVMVVTGDRELIQRCQRAASAQTRLEILSPDQLLSDMEKIMEHTGHGVDQQSTIEPNEPDVPSGLVTEYDLKLGADLLEIEAMLKKRAGMNNKRRKKLRLKGQQLWKKLETAEPRMLERVVDVLKFGRSCESLLELSPAERAKLLSKWEKLQRSRKRREKTQDRVVLAENLRLEIEEAYSSSSVITALDKAAAIKMSAKAYVFRNNLLQSATSKTIPATNEAKTGALRLVVISDTHGFEEQLTAEPDDTLPDGDLLLHLGDFAADRCPDESERLDRFDAWLARQPHETKIVLRGNHDPRFYEFALSGATYLTLPTVEVISGYSFAFIPYISGGLRRKKCMPKRADVVVSHVPPRNILDRCVTGKYAGSQTLLKGAQRMTAGPPTLWLCGHIHESRGVARNQVFCMDKLTTVVNAASANSGIASRLDYGHVVVQLGQEDVKEPTTKQKNMVEIVDMDGQYVYMNKSPGFFNSDAHDNESRRMLMAVDLGLRTGVSLFDDEGRFVRSHQLHFESTKQLQEGAEKLLDDWEALANFEAKSDTLWKVTHIAVEGAHGNPPLAEAWRQAAKGHRSMLFVKPEEWRRDLLTIDEALTGESAKSASRRLAQQIVSDYGTGKNHQLDECGEFPTDMAESILLGLHVSRRLGWGTLRDPPIARPCSQMSV